MENSLEQEIREDMVHKLYCSRLEIEGIYKVENMDDCYIGLVEHWAGDERSWYAAYIAKKTDEGIKLEEIAKDGLVQNSTIKKATYDEKTRKINITFKSHIGRLWWETFTKTPNASEDFETKIQVEA